MNETTNNSKQGNPIVSIVTVCFNAQDTIENVMESVLSQDYDKFEYIIKDGCSTDDTMQKVLAYQEKFAAKGIPMQVVSEKDQGIYDAMNHAVTLCSGIWVNFMNADDKFYNEKVLSDIFSENTYEDSDVLYGDTLECEFGEYYYYMKDLGKIEDRMPFSHQSTFAKRTVLLTYPFNLYYRLGADYDFLLNAYQAGLVFTDVNVLISVIAKEGQSSLSLYESFTEAVALHNAHGIQKFTENQLELKITYAEIKQFGMSHFPKWLIYVIRKIQRFMRGQKRVA